MERAIGRREDARTNLTRLYYKFREIEDTLLATYSASIIKDYTRLMEDLDQYGDMYTSVLRFENYLITNPGIEIAYICISRSWEKYF